MRSQRGLSQNGGFEEQDPPYVAGVRLTAGPTNRTRRYVAV
jgi:hypothetical protein